MSLFVSPLDNIRSEWLGEQLYSGVVLVLQLECYVAGQVVQYQYPLHLVSYCADDKSDKKMFTFIAKEKDSDRHHCFVFDSEKCVSNFTFSL